MYYWATSYTSISPECAHVSMSRLPYATVNSIQSANVQRWLCMFSTFLGSCRPVGSLDSALKIALIGYSPHRLLNLLP
ncbi:hypothetical protein BDQ94DRAFT_35118 [Aspergillus welwitschiae]|uniref:Uncharacterized protein n=1 Tax=Aspergillus welwitschiae TaxID=1341132 RepID=A0A3F3Q2J2_9EURO|nr:hypothetical protein BDQ94DRAFT_35118 [Aspergillus welwitschiae]RDH33383.1 hypothetical protein BDQ94DRAFT_35118 [Aspergillus welwitschiae]